MKRTLFLAVAAMLFAGTVASARESFIIDFTLLDADCIADERTGENTQNRRTVMDYSIAAGISFTNDQKSLMKTSLAMPEWEIVLNSSAKNPVAVALSQVVSAPVRESAEVPFAGRNVMGVRVMFPTWTSNANARIVPAFDIPGYEPYSEADDDGNRDPNATPESDDHPKYLFEGGYGVVTNVGTIKSISVTTMGLNFPHELYVLLKDNDGVERRYKMGNLFFDGWKTLVWNNPDYISEVRSREIRVYPIYPRGIPLIRFGGFLITRDANDIGEDFIGYFKDVKVIYDLAVLEADRDIDDEDVWGIITKRERDRQNGEMTRFGNKQVNRFIERSRMATEEAFTSSLDEGAQQGGVGAAGAEPIE